MSWSPENKVVLSLIKCIRKGPTPIATSTPTPITTLLKNMLSSKLWSISDPQHLNQERAHLTKSLTTNGYSRYLINKTFQQVMHPSPKPPKLSPPPLSILSFPYIHGITYHISKLLIKKNIKTIFKPHKTLKQLFRRAKDKSNPFLSQGVYQIPCSCGKTYIGQTCRSIQTHLKEHINDTNHNPVNKYAIVEHSFKSKHHICFDQTKILASTSHYSSRLIREAIKIEKNPNFNW